MRSTDDTDGVKAEIVAGYVPGCIGAVTSMHGIYYAREWGFSRYFESVVASGLVEFFDRYDPARDGFWTVSVDDRIEASIAIDGIDAETQGAHVRWFIVSDSLRGSGAGGRLMDRAMEFCRDRGYRRVYLETFAGLDAARHLYEAAGFAMVAEQRGMTWGTEVLEQRFECELDTGARRGQP